MLLASIRFALRALQRRLDVTAVNVIGLTVGLACCAMLLAVIGLASLVAYLTRLRMNEIGIRKALGGSVVGILLLLNREYVQIVGLSALVGAPLAGWIAHA